MNIEFDISELQRALTNPLVSGTASSMVRDEFKKIIDKHKAAAIAELNALAETVSVRILSDPSMAVTRVRITTPDQQ